LENIPSLAGQPAFFILNQLFLMREGVRKVEAMASFVKELKDDDLNALSEHYSKLPAKPSQAGSPSIRR
jgi:cytochrome c553